MLLFGDTRCDAFSVPDSVDPDYPQRLRLRYPAVCATCGIEMSKGSEAFWDRATKQVTCLACAPDGTELTPMWPEYPRRPKANGGRHKRVEDVRSRYGDHAAAVAEEMAGRDTAATWGKGSEGESRLAAYVAREVGDTVIPLHDRLIPGTRGNIDHIFVAPTGVWVVDPKAYKGKLEKREVGPIWRRENQVFVADGTAVPSPKVSRSKSPRWWRR